MPRWLRYTLLGVVTLALLLVVLIWAAVVLVDPNAFKPRIVALVEQKKQRTLTPRGDLKVTVFPRLGVELNDVHLSERRSTAEFASMQRARFYLAWWPLLHKEFVVTGVRIEGLAVHLKRYKDGTTNFADLLRSEDKSPLVQFQVDGIRVEGAALTFDDHPTQRAFTLSKIALKTGALAKHAQTSIRGSGAISMNPPLTTAAVTFSSLLDMDVDAKRFALRSFSLSVKGSGGAFANASMNLTGAAQIDGAAKTVAAQRVELQIARRMNGVETDVRMTAAEVMRQANGLMAKDMQVSLTYPAVNHRLTATASLQNITKTTNGVAFSPLHFVVDGLAQTRKYRAAGTAAITALSGENVELRNIRARLSLQLPGTLVNDLVGNVTASADIAPGAQQAHVNLAGAFDQSAVTAKFNIRGWKNPAINFDIGLDRLDLNRYRTKKPSKAPTDFSVLKTLEQMNADGTIRVGTLVMGQTTARNAVLQIGEPQRFAAPPK